MSDQCSVLIIDDSEDDRDVYERLLRTNPAIDRIEKAETGDDGVDRYRTDPLDCILLDFNLPGHNGLTILEQIKALDRYASVVMLTGEGSEDIAVAAMKAGASDYAVKDTISAIGLRRAVSNAIEKSVLQRKFDEQQEEQENFLRTLIHDVRAPLRHLSTFANLLDADIRAGNYDEVLEHNEAISISTKRIQDLIDTLASYALSESDIQFKPVCMMEIIETAIDNLSHRIEEKGAVVNYDKLPIVTGHAPQLIQLLQNLIGNGIKYCDADAPEVTVSAGADEPGFWRFDVQDNGIGIPEDQLSYVFEPFKRLWSQDVYEGTGLGLAICRKIVERHGGKIGCESENDIGSCFYFTLKNGPVVS